MENVQSMNICSQIYLSLSISESVPSVTSPERKKNKWKQIEEAVNDGNQEEEINAEKEEEVIGSRETQKIVKGCRSDQIWFTFSPSPLYYPHSCTIYTNEGDLYRVARGQSPITH